MLAPVRFGARLLAGALALTLLPNLVLAQDAAPTVRAVHPWKAAYAKRMAEEGMHRRGDPEERKERERQLRTLARRLARSGRSSLHVRGERARPATPEMLPEIDWNTTPRRGARTFGSNLFTTPANHIVNDRSTDGPSSGQSETSIAAFGDLMVAAWNDFLLFPGDTQGWATSIDGGLTWTDRGVFPHPGGVSSFAWTSDPVLTVNEKTGAFYFSALCDYNNAFGVRSGVAVVKGRFNGSSFAWATPAIARDAPFLEPDKEWVVADSSSGRVYLSYSRFPAGGSRIEFQWADSNASVWSTPRQLSLTSVSELGFVQGSRPVVDGEGRVYVVYELIGAGFSDYYKICYSDNGGVTFTTPTVAESLYTNFGTGSPGFNRNHGVDFCGISVDRSHGPHRGRVYLSWAESINWLDEVFDLGTAGSLSEVEPDGTAPTATPITIGQTVRGAVANATDVDLYSCSLTQGQYIVVAADSVQTGPANGLSVRLIASDGLTRLTFTTVDASANPTGPQPEGFPTGWMFTAPTSGTYYVRVAAFNGSGSYRLRTGTVHRGTERGRDQRDVFVGFSDNGTAWSDPARVNEDPPGFDNWIPEVAVALDGGVYCSWYDYRDSAPSRNGGEASVYLARSGDGGLTWTTLGAVADSLSNWGTALTDIEPNQGDYMSLLTSSSYIWPCWSDARRGNPDVFTAQVPLIANGAQIAFRGLQLGNRRISMTWQATPADTLSMRLYRSDDGGPYVNLDAVQFDGAGDLAYTDTTVIGDHLYAYRLGRFTNGVELFYGQVRVFLPSTFPLSMSASPNPVVGNSLTARFSLARNEPADVILFDISGREVYRQPVNPVAGPQVLSIPVGHGLRQGMYVLTVRQGGHNASTRVQLVR